MRVVDKPSCEGCGRPVGFSVGPGLAWLIATYDEATREFRPIESQRYCLLESHAMNLHVCCLIHGLALVQEGQYIIVVGEDELADPRMVHDHRGHQCEAFWKKPTEPKGKQRKTG